MVVIRVVIIDVVIIGVVIMVVVSSISTLDPPTLSISPGSMRTKVGQRKIRQSRPRSIKALLQLTIRQNKKY